MSHRILTNRSAATAMINALPDERYTYVRILGAARGVGGDDSWGAPVYPEYCVSANKEQRVAFAIKGL